MTKRTAMLMAAGVVAALLGGSVALAFGLSGNTTASAETATKSDPIVRTIHRTVRVDKQAKGSDEPVQIITVSSNTSSSAPATSMSDDSSQTGSETESDDTYESDDEFESDDESSEQESSDDSSSDDQESSDDSSGADGFGDD